MPQLRSRLFRDLNTFSRSRISMRAAWHSWITLAVYAPVFLSVTLAARGEDRANVGAAIVPEAVRLGRPVDFEKDVYPILEANCLACHNAGIAESKLNIETVDSIRKGGKRGPAIIPKNADASLLLQFAARAKQPAMPPLPNKVEANALTPRQLGLLKQWILEGARAGAGSSGDSLQWHPIPAGMKSIFAVALSPGGGRFVAAGGANQIEIYDAKSGRAVQRLIDPVLSDVQLDGHPMYPEGAADRDFVHALAFSPDGSLLAAGGYRVVKLWMRPHDVQKQSVMLADTPTALAVSPDGALVATALADRSIVLRRAEGAELRKLTGASGPISAVEFAPDGKTLYAASLDRTLRAWNVSDGTARGVIKTPAPQAALVVNRDGTRLVTGGSDGMIRLWSTALLNSSATAGKSKAPSQPLSEWKAHEKPITSLSLIVTPGNKLISGSEDGSSRIWEIATKNQLARLGHGGPVTALAVRPDGQVFASAGTNGVTRLWKTSGGAPIAEIKGRFSAARLVAERGDDEIVARQHLALAEGRIKAAEQDVKDRQEGFKKAAEARSTADKALADVTTKVKAAVDTVAAAKKLSLAQPKDAALKVKLADAEKAWATLEQAKKSAADAAISAARRHEGTKKVLAAGEQKLTEQHALKKTSDVALAAAAKGLSDATAVATKRQRPLRSIAFSADGNQLAVAGDDSEIELCDAHSGGPLETLSGHSAPIVRVAFGKGSTLVSAGGEKKLVTWETNPRWKFFGRSGPKSETPLELSGSPFVDRVLCLAFNHDGTLLATGGGQPSRSGELKTWRIPSLRLDRDFKDAHSDTVFGLDFSRDGRYLASCAADKFVKVFDVHSGTLVRSLEGHTHQVLGVSWKSDGSLLASAGADNQIKIWNFETGEQQRSIASHAKQVTSIQFLGTTFDFVTASGDKTVRLHHGGDGENYRTLEGSTDYLYSAAATADGSIVAAGGEDGVLRLWNGSTGKSLATIVPPQPTKNAAQASLPKR
jgi:WD40 repeat protein